MDAASQKLPSFLLDGPCNASLTLALAHGAGAPMDSPFMEFMATHVAAAGWRVARFEFPYMAKRRVDDKRRPPDREAVLLQSWTTVVDALGPERLVVGGKSLGGRIASMVADETGVRGLVCLGYPFHPPGRPERTRTAHLATLRTPTLIVQGARDPFGVEADTDSYTLSPAIGLHWLGDGDHSFKPRKKSGRTLEQNLLEAARSVAGFLGGLGVSS